MRQGAPGDAAAGTHLAGHELVDALDGTLDPRRLAHAASCRTCSEQIEELRGIAGDVAAVDVPEPPAFFWNQLSARVRAAVAEEQLPGPWSLAWRRWGRPALAIAAAVVIAGTIVSLTGLWPSSSGTSAPPPAVALQTQDDLEPDEDVFAQIDNDEAWALVRTLAEDLNHDEMEGEGVSARPGAADHLASELTAAERIELARLLQEQLKSQSSDSAS
ncbi:MAG TPA: hypothetical protein VFT24_13715 [Vicinamibacterales bacterium]|nr:hypothetical protein [Vicinamibacterales bacterium]